MHEALDLLERYAQAGATERPELARQLSKLTQRAIDQTGRGVNLTEVDLTNRDLRHVDLRRATLNRAILHGTRLDHADLSEVTMVCPAMERTSLVGASLRSAYVHALAVQTCKLDNADLTGLRDATGTLFHGCSMRGARLDAAHLAGSSFYQCDLSGASMTSANLQGSLINECLLDEATLRASCVDQLTVTKSSLRGASLEEASGRGLVLQRLTSADGLTLRGADLPRLRLDGVTSDGWQGQYLRAVDGDFTDVAITRAVFAHADLTGASLRRCAWPGVDLTAASLVNAKVVGSLLRDAKAPRLRAENLSIVESDLAGSALPGAMARCLTARDTNLAGADLTGANLYRAMLTGDPPTGMSLRGAILDNATLVQAYLAADLREARLTGANCAYSRFSQSNLSEARLDGANMYQSTWVKADLSRASLTDVRPPIFIDRCAGLASAVDETAAGTAEEFRTFIDRFAAVLTAGRTGST